MWNKTCVKRFHFDQDIGKDWTIMKTLNSGKDEAPSTGLSGLGVWVINLPSATDRLTNIRKQLDATGLSYRVHAGVDGVAEADRIADQVDVAAFSRTTGRPVLWGGIGCYLSHLAVWKEFLASSVEIALVLEDDAILHPDFLDAVDLSLRARSHWDFLKLGRVRAKLPVRQGFVGPYALNAYVGPATGTSAYLINRQTAARLLAKMLPITRPTDHEINRFYRHDIRLLGLEPFPSHQSKTFTSLIAGPDGYRVAKFPRHHRLPSYGLRLTNYGRRMLWLLRKGMLWPRTRQLLPESSTPIILPSSKVGQ